MAGHNQLGKSGEELAAKYLKEKGYRVLDRNYRFKGSEVDLFCEFDNQLVVVEVKTRQSSYLAGPEETVGISKQRSIIKVTNQYILEREIDWECRFDIVSVILNSKELKIDHLEDAFYPTF